MLGCDELPAHRTAYLVFEVSKKGTGGDVETETSVVPRALYERHQTQIDYFYLRVFVCPFNWGAACMMRIGCLLAPTFMGEFFHLCLMLLKLVIEVIMERVAVQIDNKNYAFLSTSPLRDLHG